MSWEDYLPQMSPMRSGDGGAPVFMPDYDPHMQQTARMRDYLDYMQEQRAAQDRAGAKGWMEATAPQPEPAYRGVGQMAATTDPGEYGLLQYLGDLLSAHNKTQNEMIGRVWGGEQSPEVRDWMANKALMMAAGSVRPKVGMSSDAFNSLLKSADELTPWKVMENLGYPNRATKLKAAYAQPAPEVAPFTATPTAADQAFYSQLQNKVANKPTKVPGPQRGTSDWFQQGYQVSQDPEFAAIARRHSRSRLESQAQTKSEDTLRDYYGQNVRQDLANAEEPTTPFTYQNMPQLEKGWISEFLSSPNHSLNLSKYGDMIPWNKIANAIPEGVWDFITRHPVVSALGVGGPATYQLQQMAPNLSMGNAQSPGLDLLKALASSNSWSVTPPKFDAQGNMMRSNPEGAPVTWISMLKELL